MHDDILDRAAEIARSGDCPDLAALKAALRGEGFAGIDAALGPTAVALELGRLCRQARMRVRRRPAAADAGLDDEA